MRSLQDFERDSRYRVSCKEDIKLWVMMVLWLIVLLAEVLRGWVKLGMNVAKATNSRRVAA
jgi:hypothetical protein